MLSITEMTGVIIILVLIACSGFDGSTASFKEGYDDWSHDDDDRRNDDRRDDDYRRDDDRRDDDYRRNDDRRDDDWQRHDDTGGDTDSHGCSTDGGYTWCESLGKCIQNFKPGDCPVDPGSGGGGINTGAGYCQYNTTGTGTRWGRPCNSDEQCEGAGRCLGGLETSSRYCPDFAGFPYLKKNTTENTWYCYSEPDGDETGNGEACNYNGPLSPPDGGNWGFNENIRNCALRPGCCDNKTIANSCATFDCPDGLPRRQDYLSLSCPTTGCSIDACCGPNPKCSTFKCPSTFYTERYLKEGAEDITCAGSRCTTYECCTSQPTGDLPNVLIWPISNENILGGGGDGTYQGPPGSGGGGIYRGPTLGGGGSGEYQGPPGSGGGGIYRGPTLGGGGSGEYQG